MPIDAWGRPVRLRVGLFRPDLVDEWQEQALSLVRKQHELCGQPSVGLHVTLGFVFVAILAGLPWGPAGCLASCFALFTSNLFQQLPGALWARWAGTSSIITLSALGDNIEPRPSGLALVWRTLMGSLINLALASALLLASHGATGLARPLLLFAGCTHGVWGLAQALPVIPFQAGRAIATRLPGPWQVAFGTLSLAVISLAGGLLFRLLEQPLLYPVTVFAGAGAVGAFRTAVARMREERANVPALIARAEALLHTAAPAEAYQLAQSALHGARLEPQRSRLQTILAWAAIGGGDPFQAHAAMQQLPPCLFGVHLVAAYLACCNRNDEATKLLRDARSLGQREPETTKLLIDLLVKTGASQEAMDLAKRDRDLLSPDDLRVLYLAGIAT